MQKSISKKILLTEQLKKCDSVCKTLLSEKQILARILKDCVKEFEGCTTSDIVAKYIEGTPEISKEPVMPDEVMPEISGVTNEDTTVKEGTVTYDIRFDAVSPGDKKPIKLIINIEAQDKENPGYKIIKRAIYYCSRLISSQKNKVFHNDNYNKIRKVYSIWICTNPSKKRRNSITKYELKEDYLVGCSKLKKEDYDLLTVVMIYLDLESPKAVDGVVGLLNTLLTNEIPAAVKREILQNTYDIEMEENLEREVNNMCNVGEGIAMRYMEKGWNQGLEKGLEQGLEHEKINSVKLLMKNMNCRIEEAFEILEITKEQQIKIKEVLAT